MAAELHVMNHGTHTLGEPRGDGWKYFEGGILYLCAEPEWFWSMMLHYRETGSVAPRPKKARLTWDDSVWCREMDRMVNSLKNARTRHGMTPSQAAEQLVGSHSFACVAVRLAMDHEFMPPAIMGARTPALPNRTPYLPCPFMHEDGPPGPGQELPQWWRNAARPWDRALDRARARGGRPLCMFFTTPRGPTWDLSEDACVGVHEQEWQEEVDRAKAAVRALVVAGPGAMH